MNKEELFKELKELNLLWSGLSRKEFVDKFCENLQRSRLYLPRLRY
jgi:hypothetical protein